MQCGTTSTFVHFLLLFASFVVPGLALAAERSPIPDPSDQEKSRKEAAEIYRSAFLRAETALQKIAIAKELCGTARGIPNGSADQYVLLRIARDIAVGAGDVLTALQAAEMLSERFDMPSAKYQGETLLAVARQASTADQQRAATEAASGVIDSLANVGEYELAVSVCERARSLAESCRDSALAEQLSARLQCLTADQEEFTSYQVAVDRLKGDPKEPVSNSVAGRYLCFVRGDWERGLPMLALGTDSGMKAAASQDLRGGDSPEAQVSVADAWWRLAEKEEEEEKRRVAQRAAYWYRRALPNLLGLTKIKAEKRLAETASHQLTNNPSVRDGDNGVGTGESSSLLAGRQESAKKVLLVEHGGTDSTEEAVSLGLEWLVKQQNIRTGMWSLQGPYGDGGGYENTVAATAMALLALQGNGNTHQSGKHQRNVERAAEALVELQDKDGVMFREGTLNHRLYTQAQATMAVCELYGMTKDPKYRQPAQKALDCACRIQAPQGGWRYVPKEDTDTSVTGWFVVALQTGLMAGLTVPSSTLDGVGKYLDTATTDGSTYAYQAHGQPTLTMSAEALLCRQYLGWKHDDPQLRTGVDLLLSAGDLIDGQPIGVNDGLLLR